MRFDPDHLYIPQKWGRIRQIDTQTGYKSEVSMNRVNEESLFPSGFILDMVQLDTEELET